MCDRVNNIESGGGINVGNNLHISTDDLKLQMSQQVLKMIVVVGYSKPKFSGSISPLQAKTIEGSPRSKVSKQASQLTLLWLLPTNSSTYKIYTVCQFGYLCSILLPYLFNLS